MSAGEPSIRGFQFDPGVIGALKSSVNLYRGTVTLPLPILSIPGRNGMDISLSALFRGVTREEVTTWNREAPTGVLGLGWDFPVEEIVVEHRTGVIARPQASYWLRSGGQVFRLLPDGDGFITDEYRFWKVSYDAEREEWTVLREDGAIWTYGGQDTDAARCLEYGLAWENWQGPSTASRPRRYPTAWKLRSMRNHWGDEVSFTYEYEDAEVYPGSPTYTRESRLATIQDRGGHDVRFSYADKLHTKEVQEYQPERGAADGYQERYATKYLTRISVERYGTLLFETLFESTPQDFSDTGHPGLFKRTLDSLSVRYPGRDADPGLAFSYCPAESEAPGSLEAVAYPHGGKATYQYGRVALEHAVIAAPIRREPGTPGVWFGPDYTVFTFQNRDTLSVVVYAWSGGWVECLRQSAAAPGDVEKLRVSCRRGYFVVHYDQSKSANAGNTAIYAQKRYQPDQWERVLDLDADALAAGDGYVAVQPSGRAEVRVYQCLEGRVLQAGSFTTAEKRVALAAGDGVFTVLACDEEAHTGRAGLISRDERGNWSYAEAETELEDLHWADWLRDSFWSIGPGFAAATYRNAEQTEYSVAVLSWLRSPSDPQWQRLGHYPLSSDLRLPFDWTSVSGSVIGNCQHLWRYDGTRWRAGELGTVPAPPDPETVAARFVYADDVAIMATESGGGTLYTRCSYDPGLNDWGPPTRFTTGDAGDEGPAPATVSRDYASVGSDLYARNEQGGWTRLGLGVLGPTVNPASVRNLAPSYFLSEDSTGSDSSVLLLKNGQIAPQAGGTYVTLPGERTLVTGKEAERSGTFLAGGMSFVTYSGGSFNSGSLKLYRILDAEFTPAAQRHTAAVVKGLTFSEPGSAYSTFYDYNETLPSNDGPALARGATYSAGSRIAQFSRVGIHQGVAYGAEANTARPAGIRIQYFLNGVRPDAGGVFYPYGTGSVTNCRAFYGALNGTLLYEESYDGEARLVSCGIHYWFVETRETDAGSAAYTQLRRTVGVTDADWGFEPGKLPAGVVEALNARQLPLEVRERLAARGLDPSAALEIVPVDRGERWLILDHGHDRGFVAALNGAGELGLRTGLRNTQDTVFHPRNGLPAESTTLNVGLDGQLTWNTVRTRYLCDVHEEQAAKLNLLNPVAQTTTLTRKGAPDAAPEYLQSEVTLWWPWTQAAGEHLMPQPEFSRENPLLSPRANFAWSGSSAAPEFDAWTTGQPAPDAWRLLSWVALRSPGGMPVETVSADGVTTSYLYGLDESQALVQFVNSRVSQGEASWYGFEEYERNPGWKTEPAAGEPRCTTDDARTGARGGVVAPGTGLVYRFAPGRPQRYVFSAWVKSAGGPHPAAWEFTVADGGKPAAAPLPIPDTGGEWSYLFRVIDLSAAPSGAVPAVKVRLNNPAGGSELQVDELRLCAMAGGSTVRVIDSRRPVVTALVDTNGRATFQASNRADRGTATVTPGGAISLQSHYTQPPGQPEGRRSSILGLSFGTDAAYTAFKPGNWGRVCRAGQPTAWQVTEGSLQFGGSSSDTLSFPGWGDGVDVALQLELEPPAEQRQPLRWLIGDALELRLEPGGVHGTWRLLDSRGTSPAPVPNPRGGAVTVALAATGGYFFLFVEGALLFSHPTAAGGPLRLVVPEAGLGLRHLATGRRPNVSVQYPTPTGAPGQTHLLDEGAAIIRAEFGDPLGRPAVKTKAACLLPDAAHPLLAYRDGFARMDWSTGKLAGALSDYYSPSGPGTDDGGYPFSRVQFDSTPLGRTRELGRPGAADAIQAGASHTTRTEWGVNGLHQLEVGLPAPASQFRLVRAINPDGIHRLEFQDKLGRSVATVTVDGNDSQEVEVTEYDALGNVSRLLPPLAFGPQGEAFISAYRYDPEGHLVEATTPDGGRVVNLYSPAGRLRFSQDAEGRRRAEAGQPDAYFHYWTYDEIGRPLESGILEGKWNTAELKAYAANAPLISGKPDWPTANTPGASWRQRHYWDGDGTGLNALNGLVKQQTRTVSGADEVIVTEEYAYDAADRIVRVTTQVAPGGERDVVEYDYDAAGNVVRQRASGCRELAYTYDRQNRLVALGTPANPAEYARFEYTPEGRLSHTLLSTSGSTLAVPRSYDSAGRLLRLGDPAGPFFQELFYQQRPDGGAGYFDGSLSALRERLQGFEGGVRATDWVYQLDSQGQLRKATRHAAGDPAGGWSLELGYDPNGNFLTTRAGGAEAVYHYAQNRVVEVTGAAAPGPLAPAGKLSYDANGSVTGVAGRSLRLESDAFSGLLTGAVVEGGAPARVQVAYGSQERRARKRVTRGPARAVKQYLYGVDARPLREQTCTGEGPAQNLQLIYGPYGLLAVEGAMEGAERLFLIQDYLGSTRVVLNAEGKPVAGYDYLPFGGCSRTYGSPPESLSHLYTGQEWEPELGLYNYQARMYDPELGRFYARDPLNQFASPYLYVGNNPLAYTDPTGRSWVAALEGILGGVVLALGIALGAFTGGASAVGASAWAIAIFGGMASGALMGAGGTAIGYAISHPQDEDGYRTTAFWNEVAIGAATGAIAGGIGRMGSQLATLAAEKIAATGAATVEEVLLSWVGRSTRAITSSLGGLTSGSVGAVLHGQSGGEALVAGAFAMTSSFLEAGLGEATHGLTSRMGVQWHGSCCVAGTRTQWVRGGLALILGATIGGAVNSVSNITRGDAWDRNLGASLGVGAFIGLLTSVPRYLPRGYRDARAPSIQAVPQRGRSTAALQMPTIAAPPLLPVTMT